MQNKDSSVVRVFIGIDVHKRQYTVCCRREGAVVKRASMVGRPEEVVKFIENNFSGEQVSTVYEAGFSGFGLHRVLEAAGHKSIVVHAASIEISLKKVKNDKRDSYKMAEQLEAGRLRSIRIPTESEDYLRQIPRARDQIIRARTRLKNQIRMRLHYFGLLDPLDKRGLSREHLKEVRKAGIRAELEAVLKAQEAIWDALDEQLKIFNRSISLGSSDELVQRYLRVPGFGKLISVILARELGDMSQFKNIKDLFSFTGLTPSLFSTDDNSHLGHITRQGQPRLRHLLVQAAWVAIKKDRTLREAFNRIAAKAGKKKAIVAIARKLIGKARAVVRDNEKYEIKESKMAA